MLVFSVNFDKTNSDKFDRKAARLVVDLENERRAALETPIDPLPTATNSELWASYKIVLGEWVLANAHNSYVQQSDTTTNKERKEAFAVADQSVQDQIDTLLGL